MATAAEEFDAAERRRVEKNKVKYKPRSFKLPDVMGIFSKLKKASEKAKRKKD